MTSTAARVAISQREMRSRLSHSCLLICGMMRRAFHHVATFIAAP
jgi:hypothetical protein